jgi:hypothetical protein
MNIRDLTKTLLAALTAASSFTACLDSDDAGAEKDPPPGDTTAFYAFANSAGAFPSQTTYIQVRRGLDFTALDNKDAIELSGSAALHRHGRDLYATRFGDPATMIKYSVDSAGDIEEKGRLVVPGARTYSVVCFVSATEAYATFVSGASNVMRFNPATMEKTGEVDMSGIFRRGAKDSLDYTIYYLGALARDGKLFLSVHYDKGFVAAYDSAFVAVIDLASGKFEKLLSDGRTNGIFGNGHLVNTFAIDESGDIYVQSKPFDSTISAGKVAQPSGILRIRKGETGFDPDYFFDLKAATGNDCYGVNHFGGGVALTSRIEDPTDPWEFNGANYKVWRIDLARRESLGEVEGIPKINGSSNSIMCSFDGKTILINAAADDEHAIYSHDPATGKTGRKFTMVGRLGGIYKL